MKRNTVTTERGFSLLEMTMVVGILSLVLAVTMTAINDVQKRARVEEAKVDLTQESREFVEQMVRDLHQAGYPTTAMYTTVPAVTPATLYAQGLLTATTTSISFEGDVDGDGAVDVVQYRLLDGNGAQVGPCPCTLQRSQVSKAVGGTSFNQEVDSVVNSKGVNAWVIAGTTGNVLHDDRYASYKTDPIFRYYDQFGAELTPPLAVANVRSVRITVNTLSSVIDPITGTYPASSLTASARIANK